MKVSNGKTKKKAKLRNLKVDLRPFPISTSALGGPGCLSSPIDTTALEASIRQSIMRENNANAANAANIAAASLPSPKEDSLRQELKALKDRDEVVCFLCSHENSRGDY